MKLGGKKKLDTLMQLLQEHGPVRIAELSGTAELKEAQAAAKALKSSAANLGLGALEDLCDQILEAKAWTLGHPLAAQAKAALASGSAALQAERSRL
jgi:HPt (histidine-containing phosphotransfer) domain-containing protein